MTRFLALRKHARAPQLGVAGETTETKRGALSADAEPTRSRRLIELHDLGLHKFKTTDLEAGRSHGVERLGNIGCYIVDAADPEQARRAAAVLEDAYVIVPDIALSLPVADVSRRRTVTTPRRVQWPEASGVPLARRRGITGRGVIVGVLDTGCDADHTEFARRTVDFRYVPFNPSPDAVRDIRGFDSHGHGTHVAGIIAGRNVGIAPDVELMVASVIESENVRTSLERIVVALDWMLERLRQPASRDLPMIINMSLGFRPEWISAPHFKNVVDALRGLLRTLMVDFDVLPVVAIGNDGPGVVRAPALFPEALAVGAVDFSGAVWAHSGGGRTDDGAIKPDVAGYGAQVVSGVERDVSGKSLYTRMSGTSMAAPYVAGIAALVASADPGLQGAQLRSYLLQHAFPLDASPERVGVGLARFV